MARKRRKKRWIKKALKTRRRCHAKKGAHHRKRCRVEPAHKGALRRALGVRAGHKIPLKKLRWAAKQPGKLGQRARFALNVRKRTRR